MDADARDKGKVNPTGVVVVAVVVVCKLFCENVIICNFS